MPRRGVLILCASQSDSDTFGKDYIQHPRTLSATSMTLTTNFGSHPERDARSCNRMGNSESGEMEAAMTSHRPPSIANSSCKASCTLLILHFHHSLFTFTTNTASQTNRQHVLQTSYSIHVPRTCLDPQAPKQTRPSYREWFPRHRGILRRPRIPRARRKRHFCRRKTLASIPATRSAYV